jgi:integrase/recombinase XerD
MSGLSSAARMHGPLAPFAQGYERWLVERGFRQETVRARLSQFADVSMWLESEGLSVEELGLRRMEEFLAARRAAGFVKLAATSSLRLPAAYLRGLDVLPADVRLAGPVDRLLAEYRRYLVLERGLASTTIDGYESVARGFLNDRERRFGGLELGRLSAADVSEFLARELPRYSIGGARGLVAKLRPLLVYLHVSGRVSAPLRWAVPGVADTQGRSLPRAVGSEVVASLLGSCDRRQTTGCRDYAILMLLVRLGLRAEEVSAIQLDDIDWRAGEMLVRGKAGRRDLLPLPVDVGEALVDYLQQRPASSSRAVLLRALAPAGPVTRKTVHSVVSRACRRVGVTPVSAHQLRHTAATKMLRSGGSLAEIAQVLRHRQLKTTAIYARVDHAALRALALPWPEGGAA